MKIVKILVGTILASSVYASDTDKYNFCGYKQVITDPEKSQQFKDLKMDDNFVVKPTPTKSTSNKILDDVILGYGKTLKKYVVKPYNKDNAKADYIDLPEMSPFMMAYYKDFKKTAIPAAWVYWVGDGEISIDHNFQPTHRVLEVINFIFVVKGAKDRVQADKTVVDELEKTSFTKDYSDQHSSGYAGLFKQDGKLQTFDQIGGQVNGDYHGYTFEDVDNPDIGGSHFRVLGPVYNKEQNTYVYTASLSKESPRYRAKQGMCGHMFQSFTLAKTKLALDLLNNKTAHVYTTNLHTTVEDNYVDKYASNETYFTGDQQVTGNQLTDVAFVVVFEK